MFLNRDVEDVGVNDDLLIARRFFGICVDVIGVGIVVISVSDGLVGRVFEPGDSLRGDDRWVGSIEGERKGIGEGESEGASEEGFGEGDGGEEGIGEKERD